MSRGLTCKTQDARPHMSRFFRIKQITVPVAAPVSGASVHTRMPRFTCHWGSSSSLLAARSHCLSISPQWTFAHVASLFHSVWYHLRHPCDTTILALVAKWGSSRLSAASSTASGLLRAQRARPEPRRRGGHGGRLGAGAAAVPAAGRLGAAVRRRQGDIGGGRCRGRCCRHCDRHWRLARRRQRRPAADARRRPAAAAGRNSERCQRGRNCGRRGRR